MRIFKNLEAISKDRVTTLPIKKFKIFSIDKTNTILNRTQKSKKKLAILPIIFYSIPI